MSKGPKPKSVEERFHQKYAIDCTTNCWNWQGYLDKDGYGSLAVDSHKRLKSHRLSYELHKGKIPEGLFVIHECDNPSCVNPKHLDVGTHLDNMIDMKSKDRGRKGETIPWSKLTEEQAIDCLSGRLRQFEFAKLYGISKSTVCNLQSGKNWKHLHDNN